MPRKLPHLPGDNPLLSSFVKALVVSSYTTKSCGGSAGGTTSSQSNGVASNANAEIQTSSSLFGAELLSPNTLRPSTNGAYGSHSN